MADIYEAFEELEVSLDKAQNDVYLDKVVRVGANRALFILGKYYNKLDECEVYPIATSIRGCNIDTSQPTSCNKTGCILS